MESIGLLEHLTQSDALADLATMKAAEREAQCRQVVLLAEWCRLADSERTVPGVATSPGSEQRVQLGGPGTPKIAEFATVEVASRLDCAPRTASARIAEALDLSYRLPRIWAAVRTGTVRADYARLAARKTRDLFLEQAGQVDELVHTYVDGRVGFTTFETLIAAAIKRTDPEAAREREEAERARQFVRTTRTFEGMQGLYLWADVAVTTKVMATVNALATALADLGDTRDLDPRRVTALLLLANPTEAVRVLAAHAHPRADRPVDESRLLPTVVLFVHLYGPTADQPDRPAGPVARIEGHGPLTREWVRDVLGPRARFRIQPVLDLAGQAPVEAYEIPDRHRQAVHLLTPADTYPFATSTARTVQIDHTQEWCRTCARAAASGEPSPCGCGGYTGLGNYGPMATHHHRIKTHHPGVDVLQPLPGIYLWTMPDGQIFLRDHTGTRRVTRAA